MTQSLVSGLYQAGRCSPPLATSCPLSSCALATLEGALTEIAPDFNMVAEARAFATRYFAEQFKPDALGRMARDDLASLLPMLRRSPRRLDRLSASLEAGRLGVNVRLLGDEGDRRLLAGLLHQVLITILTATTGIMAVLMLGPSGGPGLTATVSSQDMTSDETAPRICAGHQAQVRVCYRYLSDNRTNLLILTAAGTIQGECPTLIIWE